MYEFKHSRIESRNHNYLDTAVWMMAMIEKYSVDVSRGFFSYLENIFTQYFNKIYCNADVGGHCAYREDSPEIKPEILHTITWREYWEAWKLRGDDPQLYKDGYYKEEDPYRFWSRCGRNDFDICRDAQRNTAKFAYLYHLYHYDPEVKRIGHEPVYEKIEPEYIDCVKKLQFHLQAEISQRGIFVETLPTSNVIISTFKRYDKHPILKFYNLELGTKPANWPQLHVSIGTDDAGVFNTTLDNEYALLALALTKAKTKKGKPKYSQETIFRWLDRIREMGNEQAPQRERGEE